MTRWAMVADLERCVGCQTCTAACRHANATSPAVQWRKVLDIEAGTYPNVSRIFVPVGCQHCADPPCMHVCPTTATRQRADGIVTVDYDLCIGCAYCEVACPYQARFLVHEPHYGYDAAMQNEVERADPARFGVAQKCTFCSDRVDFGIENGLMPGVDPRATPACVNACIADALHFGDVDDPNSNVSRLLREQRSFRMHAELGTDPGFHYVYGKVNDTEASTSAAAPVVASVVGELRTRGVEPERQQHWDWKAAGNFICGGIGSGLFVFTAIASLRYGELAPLGWAALGIVALGLFLVLLKIGRPLRSIYVLRQPQRSWMAREAWIAAVFFPLAALALTSGVPMLLIGAATVAVLFLSSQAMILKEAKGIPAWRVSWVVPIVIVTGLAEGSGLFLAASTQFSVLMPLAEVVAVIAIILAALRGWIWRSYLARLEAEGAPTRSLAVFYGYRQWFFMVGFALPLALIAVGFSVMAATVPLFAIAGVCITAAGAVLKLVLVTRAGFNQGFALTHTPMRGSGIVGPLVKPGWSIP
jgi:Fe-S-cluster-containing dehydrogenase component/DMSO reductase anchor subunit